MSNTSIASILLVGAVYLDTILTAPRFPQEDHKLAVEGVEKRRGGNVGNSAEVLDELVRRPVRIIDGRGPPGKDRWEVGICAALSTRESCSPLISSVPNVSFAHSIFRETSSEPPSSYIIRSRANGSRTILNYNGVDQMTHAEFIQQLSSAKFPFSWIHFEGRIPETTLQNISSLAEDQRSGLLERGVTRDTIISVEAEKPGREGLRELMRFADVIFISKTWAEHEGYPSAQECLRSESKNFKPTGSIAFCTWSDSGASALDSKIGKLYHAEAWDPDKDGQETALGGHAVVDSIGAGDTFIAGIVYATFNSSLSADDPPKPAESATAINDSSPLAKLSAGLENILRFGTELASRKVFQEGFAGLGQAMR